MIIVDDEYHYAINNYNKTLAEKKNSFFLKTRGFANLSVHLKSD